MSGWRKFTATIKIRHAGSLANFKPAWAQKTAAFSSVFCDWTLGLVQLQGSGVGVGS